MTFQRGIAVRVINMSILKPLSELDIVKDVKETRRHLKRRRYILLGIFGESMSRVVYANYIVSMNMVGVRGKRSQFTTVFS